MVDMTRTVIDVGASNGLFANFIANRSQTKNKIYSVNVLAIEPIPKAASRIGERPNLKVIQQAILSKELIPISGKKTLRIMQNSELSSFLEINPNIDALLWQNHLPSLILDYEILVDCTTLERIIIDNKLNKVDFIKIDTQGTDLSAFLSAGTEINKIMSCVLEFPYFNKSAIYSQEKDISEGIEILGKLGFVPVRIVPNGAGECNVFFLNQDYSLEDYFQMESELEFLKAPVLKIGKHRPTINMSIQERSILFLKTFYKRVLSKV